MKKQSKKWSFFKSEDKTHNKKTLRIISIATISVAMVLGIIAGIYLFSYAAISNDTKSCVIYKGNDVYFSGNGQLIDITDDDKPQPVTTNTDYDYVPLTSHQSCYDTEYIYTIYPKQSALYKFKIRPDEFEREIWVEEKSLESAFSTKFGLDNFETSNMYDLCICDDYVFFYYYPEGNAALQNSNTPFRVGKISLDGKDISFLDSDIRASSIVSDGDYIYYFDNAYNSKGKSGIYRMKADGSDKELLLDGFKKESSNDSSAFLCNNLRIFSDYLYFIDDSKEGKSRVCRVNLSGSDKEYVSKQGAYRYTVYDNTLYYSLGERQKSLGKARDVYCVQIGSQKEDLLFKTDGAREFTVYNNYLYVCDYHHLNTNTNGKNIIGGRYNLSDKTMETLCCDVEKPGFSYNAEKGVYEMSNKNSRKFYWQKSDFNSDSIF